MKQYPGYTLVKHEDCPEQHGTLTVLTHDVSGAAVLLVENDDDNKAFGIGFGTFPSDDTGVFHILEHSVLAGSEKYPVKSPFLQLLKSSMASFLNAMANILNAGLHINGEFFEHLRLMMTTIDPFNGVWATRKAAPQAKAK